MGPWTENPLSCLYIEKTSGPQYSPLFPQLEKKRIPIIFADAALSDTIRDKERYLLLAETLFGTGLLVNRGIDLIKTKQLSQRLSRRDFLKAARDMALAFYLATPAYSSLGILASSEINKGHGPTAEFQKISQKLHPEVDLFVLTLRNAILAQKEQWLMEKMGERPHCASVLGMAHSGIEDQIRYSPERRLGFLRRLKPVLPWVISSKETFYQIALLDFNGRFWQVREILEEPELKELIT